MPYEVVPRRPGDVAACYADPTLAQRSCWAGAPSTTWTRMCADSWRWQSMNPNGFEA